MQMTESQTYYDEMRLMLKILFILTLVVFGFAAFTAIRAHLGF